MDAGNANERDNQSEGICPTLKLLASTPACSSQLQCPSHSVTQLRMQQLMAHVVGSPSLNWQTWTEHLALGFGLAPAVVGHWRNQSMDYECAFSLSASLSNEQKHFKRKRYLVPTNDSSME